MSRPLEPAHEPGCIARSIPVDRCPICSPPVPDARFKQLMRSDRRESERKLPR